MRSTVASAIDRSISKIYAKMNETKSLLATILVREGVPIVHNRNFLVLEQRDRDFRHIRGVVLGFIRTKRITPGSATAERELIIQDPIDYSGSYRTAPVKHYFVTY